MANPKSQVPLDKFVLTSAGETVNTDLVMTREAVRSVGISLLSRNANTKGDFELGIESIEATNDVRGTPLERTLTELMVLIERNGGALG